VGTEFGIQADHIPAVVPFECHCDSCDGDSVVFGLDNVRSDVHTWGAVGVAVSAAALSQVVPEQWGQPACGLVT